MGGPYATKKQGKKWIGGRGEYGEGGAPLKCRGNFEKETLRRERRTPWGEAAPT